MRANGAQPGKPRAFCAQVFQADPSSRCANVQETGNPATCSLWSLYSILSKPLILAFLQIPASGVVTKQHLELPNFRAGSPEGAVSTGTAFTQQEHCGKRGRDG